MNPRFKITGFKRDSKARASKKSTSYLEDDRNYGPFSAQLARIGLAIRDVGGDGNCCFRALSDQLFGNEAQHFDIRQQTCQYMKQYRDEFQPFVAALVDEDEMKPNCNNNSSKKSNKNIDSYDCYIRALETLGTYADNGCLVAFARLYELDIHIHQLDLDIWTITGAPVIAKKGQPNRQLHLAYHNGEHYSSVRLTNDTTALATNFRAEYCFNSKDDKPCTYKKNVYYDDTDYSESFEANYDQIMNVTNCHDLELIERTLVLNRNDVDATIVALLGDMQVNGENNVKTGRKEKICKKDKKRERQMERQQLKAIEKRNEGKEMVSGSQPGNEVQPVVDSSILSSMEIKSI